MADLKISQLPSATTPLAGTEVLPIVQSSATKQVSIANLTAGRSVSVADATLTTNNLVIGTSGKGIDFSATGQAAGMTSKLLNDYEEGTWTPTQGAGLIVVGDFSSSGKYTKIGRTVTFTGFLAGSTSIAMTAGGLMTSGLPYSTGSLPAIGAATNANATQGSLFQIAVVTIYAVSAIATTSAIYFSGTYDT